jgi:hypothetical protein
MSAAEYRRVEATQQTIRDRIEDANRSRPEARGPAEIIPFPVARQQPTIDRELIRVRDWAPDAAYRHLTAAVRRHRIKLKQLGISPERIAKDVRELESALGLTTA